jgi:catechol-2,3-dioxygenase
MNDTTPPIVPQQLKLSHMGMFVRDLDCMVAFYREVLGFIVSDRAVARIHDTAFMTRTPGAHHELVLSAGRPPGSGPEYAVQQISFKAGSLDDLRAMQTLAGGRNDVTDVYTVDHGNAYSLYFRDPEENRIEVYIDTPWHVSQPHHEKLDLTGNDAEILAATKARISDDPTFMSVSDYAARQREKLAAVGIDGTS